MYSCAAAAKAVLKTVDFEYNGTDGLNSLSVTNIREKSYSDDSVKPLWAVENPKMHYEDIQPLWGLVSSNHKNRDDISVLQKESLFLPGCLFTGQPALMSRMNAPGTEFHLHAFLSAFGVIGPDGTEGLADYSGSTSIAIYEKWKDLSTDAKNVSRIVNRIWTDVASNSVVGTRSWIQSADGNRFRKRASSQDGETVDVPVTLYRRRVRYHLAYGIPAFIVLAVTGCIALAACFLSLFGKGQPSVMRKYLFHTAPGRILGTYAYPGQVSSQAAVPEWNKLVGEKKVSLASPVPTPLDPVMMGTYNNVPGSNMKDPPFSSAGVVGGPPSPVAPSSPNPYHADDDVCILPG